MPLVTPRQSTLRRLAFACVAAIVWPSAAMGADPEPLAVTGGPGSPEFSVTNSYVSPNGRFVLMRLDESSTPPFPAKSGWAVRDRQAQTTAALDIVVPDAGGGGSHVVVPEETEWGPQISDDGDHVLIWSSDPGYRLAAGPSAAPGIAAAVYERSTNRVLRLPSTPGDAPIGRARLSADGSQALVTSGPGTVDTAEIYRGPLEGAGTRAIDLTGVLVEGASDDLGTFVYSHYWADSLYPPDDLIEHSIPRADPNVWGLKTTGQEPRRIAIAEYEETGVAAPVCTDTKPGARTSRTSGAAISGNGRRIALTSSSNVVAPGTGDVTYGPSVDTLRLPDGARRALGGDIVSGRTGLGQTHDLTAGADAGAGPRTFAGDDRLLFSLLGGSPSVIAQDPSGTPTDGPLVFTSDEPVDTATPPQPGWFGCPTRPIAQVGAYARVALRRPAVAGKSLGQVRVRLAPSVSARRAKSVTVDVWRPGVGLTRQTLEADGTITLPAAALRTPEIITVSVQPYASSNDTAAPPPLVTARLAVAFS